MKSIIRKLRNHIQGTDPAQAQMEYLKQHGLRIGKNFHCFSPYAFDGNWPWLISVGDDVQISTDVKILAHDASPNIVQAHTKVGLVTIGNNVFIGAGTTVLCNTRIGSNVIIGAGSVVTGNIPDNCVAAGNPARVICSIEEFRRKHEANLETHPYFDKHPWNEWINAPEADREEMRKQLEGTFGYV